MIKKIALLFIIIPFCAIGQENFKAVDSKVVWQHVFEDSISAQKYLKHVNTLISQENPAQLTVDYISGQSTYMNLIEDKSSLSAAFKKPAKFDFNIDFKEGKYRVTVRNIALEGISLTLYGVTDDSDFYLDKEFIRTRDAQLRKNKMAKRLLTRLDSALIKLFTYKSQDNW